MMLTVSLPWPHPHLSPNSRNHWRVLAKAKKQAKADAFFLAIAAGARIDTKATGAVVTVTFNPPDRRRRDIDNAISSNKAHFDGISAAIGVDDSKWHLIINAMGEPVKGGAVTVSIDVVNPSGHIEARLH